MRLAPIAASMTAAAIIIGACNKTPTAPSVLQQGGQPPPASGPVDVRLEILGPRAVAPGAAAQLTAVMHRSDNTTQDLTSAATWRSSRTTVLTMSPAGVATGVAVGESFVSATANGRTATRETIVTPAGTFRLIGTVHESDSPATPIVDARVEAIGGPTTTTMADGRYRLYGVTANSEFRISKDGYNTHVQTLALTDHQTQNFGLSWTGPRPVVSGTYRLTITVAHQCRATLPEPTFTRSYAATVVQNGPALVSTLTDATFAVDRNNKGNRFGGRVEPNRIVFSLSFWDYYYGGYADLVEEIEPTLYYIVSGTITLPNQNLTRLAGSLSGAIMTASRDPRQAQTYPERTCNAMDHQVVLAR